MAFPQPPLRFFCPGGRSPCSGAAPHDVESRRIKETAHKPRASSTITNS